MDFSPLLKNGLKTIIIMPPVSRYVRSVGNQKLIDCAKEADRMCIKLMNEIAD